MFGLSNCIIFAIKLYLRRRRKGEEGYLAIRRSRWGKFPHMLYGRVHNGRARVVSYVPINPKHKMLPPPLFHGRVKWGDEVDHQPPAGHKRRCS